MEFLKELEYDIQNGATVDEVLSAYPELKNNSKLASELHFDISKGATQDEVKTAYPELQAPKTDTSFVGALKKSTKTMGKVFTEAIPEIGSNVMEGAYSFGADIHKLKSGEFKKEILGQEVEDPTIKKGIVGKITSGAIQRERTLAKRRSDQGEGATTGILQEFENLGQGAGLVSDVIGEAFMSGLSTLTTEEQKETAKDALKRIVNTEIGREGIRILKDQQEGFAEFERQHPQIASSIRSLANFGFLGADIAGFAGAKKLGQETTEQLGKLETGIKQTGTKLKEVGTEGVRYGQSKIKVGAEKTKELGKGAKTTVTRDMPEAVVSNYLGFNPQTERAKIEKITGMSDGAYILDKGLGGKSKEELIDIFTKQVNDNYNGIKTQLAKLGDKATKSEKTTQALEDILDQLTASKKLENFYKDDIIAVKKLLQKGEYTLLDRHLTRQAFDKVNNGLYDAKGRARGGVEKDVDIDIRDTITKELTTEAKRLGVDVAEMNKELRVGIEFRNALLRRLSQEKKNNYVGLQDVGVSLILGGGDPITSTAILGGKKILEGLAPKISQKLYNLNKTKNEPRNLNRNSTVTSGNKSSKLGFGDSTGGRTVTKPKKTEKKQVIKKPLALPVGKKQAIITPQTKQAGQKITDKAIIKESKKELPKPKKTEKKVIKKPALISTPKGKSISGKEYHVKDVSVKGTDNDVLKTGDRIKITKDGKVIEGDLIKINNDTGGTIANTDNQVIHILKDNGNVEKVILSKKGVELEKVGIKTPEKVIKKPSKLTKPELKEMVKNAKVITPKGKPAVRTITVDNIDLKRLSDKDYLKQVNDSIFAQGKATDEKLYKLVQKELNKSKKAIDNKAGFKTPANTLNIKISDKDMNILDESSKKAIEGFKKELDTLKLSYPERKERIQRIKNLINAQKAINKNKKVIVKPKAINNVQSKTGKLDNYKKVDNLEKHIEDKTLKIYRDGNIYQIIGKSGGKIHFKRIDGPNEFSITGDVLVKNKKLFEDKGYKFIK